MALSQVMRRKCQMTSYSLLDNLADREIDPFDIVSEIMETNECDSMAEIRHATVEEINKGDPQRLERILADKYVSEHDRNADLKVANRTTTTYKYWYIEELQRSLTWRNWVSYKLNGDSFERDMFGCSSLALLTCGVAGILGYSWRKIPIIYGMAFPFRDKIRAWFKKPV